MPGEAGAALSAGRKPLRWYHKLALVIVSLALSTLAFEVVARQVHLFPQPGDADYRAVSRRVGVMPLPYERLTHTGFMEGGSGVKREIQMNRLGFRGEDFPESLPDDVTRLLLLGDSYTAGWEVALDERWSAWLADWLNTGDGRADVVNLGAPGFGTDRQYLLYQAYGRTLGADVVVLGMYVENDVLDNAVGLWQDDSNIRLNRPYFSLEDGALVEHPWHYTDRSRSYQQEDFPQSIIGWLNAHSATYRLLRNGLDGLIDWVRGTDDDADDDADDARALTVQSFLPLDAQVFINPPDERWEASWALTGALLAALRDAVAADGSELVVAIIPPHMIVQYDDWRFAPAFEAAGEEYELWYPQRRMTDLLAELDIPTFNPTQTFIDFHAETGLDPFLTRDRHFNPTGTCLFGTALAGWLVENGYVDAPGPPDLVAACGE